MTHDSSDTGTIVHLPECPKSADRYAMAMCICYALRACEQRVYDERNEAWVKKCRASERHALDAAREAVARLQHKPGASIANAVSAIDGLVRDYLASSQEPAYNKEQM